MLQWLLDSPDGQAESVPDMAQRLLSLNFASIHTTSMVTLRQVILESHDLNVRVLDVDHRLIPLGCKPRIYTTVTRGSRSCHIRGGVVEGRHAEDAQSGQLYQGMPKIPRVQFLYAVFTLTLTLRISLRNV